MQEYYEETKGNDNIATLPAPTSEDDSVVTESYADSGLSPNDKEDEES